MAEMSCNSDPWKAMRFQHPEFIPVKMYFLPAAWMKHREALEEIVMRHPVLFGEHEKGSVDFNSPGGGTYVEGNHIDEWGCVWSNIAAGREAFVTGHPLPEREMIWDLKAPAPGAGLPHGFMFLRLTYLRGYEEAMVDFAEEPPELQRLIDVVFEYNVGELKRMLAENPPQLLAVGDDLGMQNALPVSPEKWRRYLKPCYAGMFGMCHGAGVDVYLHSDGHIVPIIADLIECGVDVLNPQVRANGLDDLARECKGKVCLDLDLDRHMFPFATPEKLDAHVREAVEKLGSPEGGLWLTAEIGPDVPLDNIEAICQALENYRGYFRRPAFGLDENGCQTGGKAAGREE